MLTIMLLITKSIKNKVILFLTTIFLVISFSFAEAKNSRDVSNIKVQKKLYPTTVVYFDEVNQGTSREKVTKNLGN